MRGHLFSLGSRHAKAEIYDRAARSLSAMTACVDRIFRIEGRVLERTQPEGRWRKGTWEVDMAAQINSVPPDKSAADRVEAERLDLETHARLEAGLIDTFPTSDPVSPVLPAPAVRATVFWPNLPAPSRPCAAR
jgi:hypothetical protein